MKVARMLVAAFVGTLGAACGSSSAGEGAPTTSLACDGGPCDTDAIAACGSALPPQASGDCKRNVCDVRGAVAAIADDTDAPTSTEDCAEATCAGGEIVTKPKASGVACKGGTCDGKGLCVKAAGEACSTNSVCSTGFCVDGVCCNTACRGECKACDVPGTRGFCANVPYYEVDRSYERDGSDLKCEVSTTGGLCNGEGQCLRVAGRACQENANCISNSCKDLKCLGAKGEFCTLGATCVSGKCLGGACE